MSDVTAGSPPQREPVSGFLRILLLAHGAVTLLAAVVLVAVPAAIPATVGIALEPEGYLLAYLLAAAELAIALLSMGATRLTDVAAVRLIVTVFIVLHLSTAVLEVVQLAVVDVSTALLVNVGVRVVVAALFVVALRSWRGPLRQVPISAG